MHEMRDMILSLVAEGRTVVLSSHLLDEVERTCDAVAIVDRGNIIRQGPISELLAGASLQLQVDMLGSRPGRGLLDATTIGAGIQWGPGGLGIGLPGGDTTRRHRRDQPCPRRRGDLGVPAPGDPGIARSVVPVRHQPTGASE